MATPNLPDDQEPMPNHEQGGQPAHSVNQTNDGTTAQLDYYHALFNAIDEGFCIIEVIFDKNGKALDYRFLEINPVFEKQTGLKNAVGKTMKELQPAHDEFWFEVYGEIAKGNPKKRFEQFASKLGDGGIWYDVYAFSIGAPLENKVAILFNDITERKKAEQEILRLKDELAQTAEKKYHTLFNTMEEALAVCEVVRGDAGEVIDLTYLAFNPAHQRQTGLDGNTMIGRKLSEVLTKSDVDRFIPIYARVANTDEPANFEKYVQFTGRWYAASVYPQGDELSIFYRDITERKFRELNQQFLIKFSDALRAELNADALANRAIQMLAEHLQLDRCYVGIALLDENRGIFPYQVGNEKVPPMPADGVSLSDFPEALRTTFDQTLVITDSQHLDGLTQTEKQNFAALGFGALVVANARKEGNKPDWSINAVSARPRRWTANEIQLIEDVTERTWAAIERAKAEEALKNSEEKYRTLFDSMDEGVSTLEMIVDENGKVVDFIHLEPNAALTIQTKLGSTSAIVGKRASEIWPDMEPYWLETYERIIKTGVPERHEYYFVPLEIWVDIYMSRVGDGSSRHIVTVYNNITERKRHEQRQEFLLKLSDALRLTSDATEIEEKVTRLTMDYLGTDRCYYARIENDHAIIRNDSRKPGLPSVAGAYPLSNFPILSAVLDKLKPYVADDVINSGFDDSLKELCIQLQILSFVAVPVIKHNQVVGTVSLTQSSPRPWKEDEINLISDTAERLWAAVERANAEEALRESQQRFASIANLVPDLLWDSQPDGSTNWYNQQWLAYTGQGFEQAIGWGWTEAIHPDDREALARRYDEAVKAGQSLQQEHRIRRHDGVYRWFVVNATPLKDENGQVVRMYGAATDIDDLKRLEITLREADRRKDEFLAMLAHELRNPLAPVRNGLQLLAQTHPEDPLLGTMLPIMSRQMEHLLRMVDDLLDVSRISRGKIELHKQRMDLTQVVAQTVQAMQPLYTESGKQLSAQLPTNPIYLDGDATRLHQVVVNLLTNGMRYTRPGGQVWLTLEPLGEQAVLRVRDNGIGLGADQLTAIFELFVQVDTSLARSHGGLGVGLSLVRELVQMHEGRVEAYSPGLEQGSEFVVYLPILPA